MKANGMPGFVKLQVMLLVISLGVPTVCMVAAFTRVADPLTLSNVALPTVLFCWIFALLVPWLSRGGCTFILRGTSFVLAWSVIATVFPLAWDLPWAVLHDWVNGATADDVSKWYFWAYAVADTRFLHSDPLMIIVEYWSGLIAILEIAFVKLFFSGRTAAANRFFLAAGCLQLYGCTVFFCSEFLNGLTHIRPDVFSYIKFFGLNGMWMIVPTLSGVVLARLSKCHGYDSRLSARRLLGQECR